MHKDKIPISLSKSFSRSFTLVELIIVIVIVGILAAVGISQYSTTVEKSRLAEAKIRIGTMRQLAHEYYLNKGTMTGLSNDDVGVDNTCTSNSFYNYWVGWTTSTCVKLVADRCTGDGKIPDVSRGYRFQMRYFPATGGVTWTCYYINDQSPCFGFPSAADCS